MSDWRVDEATNQTIFREMNEWTREDSGVHAGAERAMDLYLCECSDAACTDPIALAPWEYEAVRAVPVRFVIAVNHENPEVDVLVREYPRYAVVDKLLGPGAQIALATDPRR